MRKKIIVISYKKIIFARRCIIYSIATHVCQKANWNNLSWTNFVSIFVHTVNLAPAQSLLWHMLCKICFTSILCWLHLRRIWPTMCQKNGVAYLTHVKQNMLHMWLIVLHLRKLSHIVCHIWLVPGPIYSAYMRKKLAERIFFFSVDKQK
jgi:hypothetical protein